MAIWGSGTSSDPVRFDTFEDFMTALGSNYTYLEFPLEDQQGNPIEKKVMDLRKKGWYTGSIINVAHEKHIEGNEWTILGMSVMNGTVLNISNYCTINNLIMKNMYIYANGEGSTFLSNRTTTTFSKCKFSAVIDASNGNDIWLFYFGSNYGASSTGRCYFDRCSFNFKFHNYFYYIGYYSNSIPTFDNCLFNFTTSEYGTKFLKNTENTSHSYYWAIYRFCKFTGNIKLRDSNLTPNFITVRQNTAFCVFDIDIAYITAPENKPSLITWNGTLTNSTSVLNNDKIHIPPEVGYTIPSSIYKCTSAQMLSKDFLESVYFLVGDTPE